MGIGLVEMTEADARTVLAKRVAASIAPVLSTADINILIAQAKRTDQYGYLPTNVAWTPTWALTAAAAEGWRWKAAELANQMNVSTGSAKAELRQRWENAMAMVRQYGSGGIGTIHVTTQAVV